jgi:hypothetical protein
MSPKVAKASKAGIFMTKTVDGFANKVGQWKYGFTLTMSDSKIPSFMWQ